MRPLYPVVATVVRRTMHAIAVTREDVERARAGRLCPLRMALSRAFSDLIVHVGCETFGLRRPDGDTGVLVGRGLLPYNARHLLRLHDQNVAVRGAHINLTIEWYEDPETEDPCPDHACGSS